MTSLSPLDALGPAFRRTREVLADPFRFGFFLKIALIAALTQPSFYSASLSYPIQGAQFAFVLGHPGRGSGVGLSGYGSQFMARSGAAALGFSAIVIMVVLGLALWVLMSYLYCRLRFTLFDLVVYKRGRVGQAWSAYGRQSWRYFGLVILVSLAFMVVAVIVVGPALLNFIRLVRPLAASGSNVNPFSMLGAMLPFLVAVFAVVALWAVVDSLMQDFLLPPMAIDDAPLESVFGRFFGLLKTSPGSGGDLRFAAVCGWHRPDLDPHADLFCRAYDRRIGYFRHRTLVYHALWTSAVGQVICVSLAILVGLVAVVIYAVAITSIYGTAAVFKQSYAAYFFGGRYAALGDRLEPPPPSAVEHSEQPPMLPSSTPPDLPSLGEAPALW